MLTKASEHLERVEGDGLLTGDGVGTAARVGAGPAGAGDIEPLKGDGWMDEVAAEPLQALSVVGLDSSGRNPALAVRNREK